MDDQFLEMAKTLVEENIHNKEQLIEHLAEALRSVAIGLQQESETK